MKKVPLGVSARHIHISKADLALLFGEGYELTEFKSLSQPGQFAANEVLEIIGSKGSFGKVRILGPARGDTQIEISRTDAYTLGINAPVRQSGDIQGTPGLMIKGPAGQIELKQGVIVAARHIHFHTSDAQKWGITNQQKLSVQCNGERPLIFTDVIARVSDSFKLDMHMDTDEANAAGVKTGDLGEILLS